MLSARSWKTYKPLFRFIFAHYNNVRVHKTLRVAPAMAANVNDRLWSLEELVERTTS
jgi:acyl carrier protein phosphodiesterase